MPGTVSLGGLELSGMWKRKPKRWIERMELKYADDLEQSLEEAVLGFAGKTREHQNLLHDVGFNVYCSMGMWSIDLYPYPVGSDGYFKANRIRNFVKGYLEISEVLKDCLGERLHSFENDSLKEIRTMERAVSLAKQFDGIKSWEEWLGDSKVTGITAGLYLGYVCEEACKKIEFKEGK